MNIVWAKKIQKFSLGILKMHNPKKNSYFGIMFSVQQLRCIDEFDSSEGLCFCWEWICWLQAHVERWGVGFPQIHHEKEVFYFFCMKDNPNLWVDYTVHRTQCLLFLSKLQELLQSLWVLQPSEQLMHILCKCHGDCRCQGSGVLSLL